MKLILLSNRDEVFCSMWAWHSTNRKFIEIHIWIVYGLCFEEPLLWDRDAYSMWALWYQPNSVSTKGSCCTIGSINHCPRPSAVDDCLVRDATLFYCTCTMYFLQKNFLWFKFKYIIFLHFLPCFSHTNHLYHYLIGHIFLTICNLLSMWW
jgi:hypothetical protein